MFTTEKAAAVRGPKGPVARVQVSAVHPRWYGLWASY